jgi:hypothetical protein
VFGTAGGRSPDAEPWTTDWAVVAAVGLLLGFVLPLPRDPLPGGHGLGWFWDAMAYEGGWGLSVMLPGLLGIAVLAILSSRRGRPRAPAILVNGAAAFIVGVRFGAGPVGFFGTGVTVGTGVLDTAALALFVLGAVATAAGNHLRRRHPGAAVPRVTTGIGGAAVVLAFLVPLPPIGPSVTAFFEATTWSRSPWALALYLAALLFGVLAAIGLVRFRDPRAYCRVLGWVTRILAAALPIGLYLTLSAAPFPFALLGAVKAALLFLGAPALMAVGLASWLEDVLSDGRRSGPSDPRAMEDLSGRLTRLRVAKFHGLVSEEDYERKRRRIIDSADL